MPPPMIIIKGGEGATASKLFFFYGGGENFKDGVIRIWWGTMACEAKIFVTPQIRFFREEGVITTLTKLEKLLRLLLLG